MFGISAALANRGLRHASQQVLWRKGVLCPCRNALSGAAAPGCPTCSGKGVIWSQAYKAWCVASGMRVQRTWAQMGQFEQGDLVVTVGSDSPLYEAGEYDRVLMVQMTQSFEAVLTYTGTETTGFPVAAINQTFWLDPLTKTQVLGGIPNAAPDGQVDWTDAMGGPTPPLGTQYSLSGRRVPEFFVFGDMPGDRQPDGTALPRRMSLRKFDLFGR